MFLQSKWSCSVNTGLICTGASLGYINLNIATVPHCSDADRRGRRSEDDSDSYDGWTQEAMTQTIYEIYQSVSLQSDSRADPLCQHHLSHVYVPTFAVWAPFRFADKKMV